MDAALGVVCPYFVLFEEYSLEAISVTRICVSARAYYCILKLARTIADLVGSEDIRSAHLAEVLHASQSPEVDVELVFIRREPSSFINFRNI
jgi:hypothetical protein